MKLLDFFKYCRNTEVNKNTDFRVYCFSNHFFKYIRGINNIKLCKIFFVVGLWPSDEYGPIHLMLG